MSDYRSMLDRLPSDWAVKPIDAIGSVVSGGTPSRAVPAYWNGTIAWVTPGELTRLGSKYIESSSERISELGVANSGATLLPPGSLLVTTRATLGSAAINTCPMTTNQGFKSVVFRGGFVSDYYYHWTPRLKAELERRASGTTFAEISGSEFKRIEVPVPPQVEQDSIAHILDTLDTRIEKTQALIAKLEQVKEGLLHDLLTRGVDENGELRPSPEAAPELYKESRLGLIPRSWTTVRVDQVGDVVTGRTPPSSDPLAWGDIRPFVTPSDIRDSGVVERAERGISSRGLKYVPALPASTTLVVCIGSTIGKVAIASVPCATNQQINAVIPFAEFDEHFVFLAIRGNIRQIHAWVGLQAVPIVNKSIFSSMLLSAPPKREQRMIAEVVQKIESQCALEQRAAIELGALKTGLMDDLLTGRVRVTPLLEREAAEAR